MRRYFVLPIGTSHFRVLDCIHVVSSGLSLCSCIVGHQSLAEGPREQYTLWFIYIPSSPMKQDWNHVLFVNVSARICKHGLLARLFLVLPSSRLPRVFLCVLSCVALGGLRFIDLVLCLECFKGPRQCAIPALVFLPSVTCDSVSSMPNRASFDVPLLLVPDLRAALQAAGVPIPSEISASVPGPGRFESSNLAYRFTQLSSRSLLGFYGP